MAKQQYDGEYQYSADRPMLSIEERDRRWGIVRERMADRGIDCLIVWGTDRGAGMGRANLRYLTQIPGHSKLQHAIAIVPLVGDPVVWSGIPHMHQPYNLYQTYQDWVDDSRLFKGIGVIAEEISDRGLDQGRLGIVGTGSVVSKFNVPHNHYEQFESKLSDADFIDCTDILNQARLIKSEEEIELLREAGDIAHAMADALMNAEPGQKECEVYADMTYEQIARGGDGYVFNMMDSGATTDTEMKHLLHGKHTPIAPSHRELTSEDLVITEYHANFGGYLVAAEKSVALGGAPTELEDIHEVALQCQQAAVDTFAPGVRLQDLWEAIRAPVKEANMDFVELGFHGHGLGSAQLPTVVYPQESTNTYPDGLSWNPFSGAGLEDVRLREGMVFGTNIDIYDPNWRSDIGIMHGDTMLVTEDGAEALIDTPTELVV